MIRNLFILIVLTVFTFYSTIYGQSDQYKVACVGFYNVENLFDTLDTPDVNDYEFTPQGPNVYNSAVYYKKLDNLALVVSKIGTEMTPDGAALLGVSEIENRSVLEDFVRHPLIANRNYQIVHFDSRDARGIDVALLYQPKYFILKSAHHIPLIRRSENGDTSFSRDILVVNGLLDDELITVTVNHWPSRSGGEKATAHLRNKAAQMNRAIIDSLAKAIPGNKFIVMGDLNDDPVNDSVKGYLKAKAKPNRLLDGDMYNPMYSFYKKGIGTTAYQDAWSLFDQVILSANLTKKDNGFRFYKARVYNEPWLVQKLGKYKGYPFRSYSGNSFLGGYSDHFPVYVFLIKEVD